MAAMRSGLNENVKTLLDAQLKMVKDDKGTSPLHVAVLKLNMQAIEMLAKKFSERNASPSSRWIMASSSAVSHKASSFENMVNSPNSNGFTPVHLACFKGSIEILKLLLNHGGSL